jgi:CTP:molybdopterin cytidylyltransferase MocA
MGRSKQLLPLGPKPVICRCLDSVLDAGIQDIVVVLGAGSDKIAAAISGMPVRTIINNDPRSDMAESVRTGIRAMDGSPSGILVCLSDHPLVSAETIRTIVRQHHETPDSVIIPCHQGKRGHPTLFPNKIITEVFSGITLRDIIRNNSHKVRAIDVDDEGVVLDMDTEEDYRMISRILPRGNGSSDSLNMLPRSLSHQSESE